MGEVYPETTVEQNRELWSNYGWQRQGEEWSHRWGAVDYQWYGTIFPRLLRFLPTGTLLEIAPGYGRWTHYLVPLCRKLIGVDLTERCVEACQQRFGGHAHTSFYVNDGLSLDMVPDNSIDFAFSFDSLVHAERDVLESYIHELAKKLAPEGVGFIHHSNLGEHVDPQTGELSFPRHWRGLTMTAPLFEQFCTEAGLACIGQEVVNWEVDPLNDCFSFFTRPGSRYDRPNQVRRNPTFMDEAAALKAIADQYGSIGRMEPVP